MSRLNDLQEAIANQNSKGGIPSDKWMVFLLTDIALSLATIADAMTREDGEADAVDTAKDIVHKAIDNSVWLDTVNVEEMHKVVDDKYAEMTEGEG